MKTLVDNTDDIYYLGSDDTELTLFENQYKVPNGISYNSYLIVDEKCVVMDTSDECVKDEWLEKLEEALDGRSPDYLVVSHMEPDHSANVLAFLEKYKDAKLIVNAKTLTLMNQFFGESYEDISLVVKDGDTLNIGKHELQFIFAPMVHWPEVMVTFDKTSGTLFSADAFGTFGALNGDICNAGDDWAREASRYYINIVGKYGVPVSNLLKKAEQLEIKRICALHGPILCGNLTPYLECYKNWSSYKADLEGTLILYASLHGNTKNTALCLAKKLQEKGEYVALVDLTTDDIAATVAKTFRFRKLALFSATYENDIMPAMHDYLYRLRLKGCRGKKVAVVENGSWGPVAGKRIVEALNEMQDMEVIAPIITIKTCMNKENGCQLDEMAKKILEA